MSIDTLDLDNDLSVSLFSFTQRVSSQWNGRKIALQDALELKQKIQKTIFHLLFSQEPASPFFDEMAAKLAWIRAEPQSRALLEKELVQLLSQPDGLYIRTREGFLMPAGFGKTVSKCWKKHKTAIIIGVVVTAIVVTAIVVAAASGGTAGAAAAAASGAAIASLQSNSEEARGSEGPSSTQPSSQPESPPSLVLSAEPLFPSQEVDPSLLPNPQPIFLENGVLLNNRYLTYWDICESSYEKELFSSILKSAPQPPSSPQISFLQPMNQPTFHENGISWHGQEFSYGQWLQQAKEEELLALLSYTSQPEPSSAILSSPPPQHSIREQQPVYEILEKIGQVSINPAEQNLNPSPNPERGVSRRFETPGAKIPHCAIGGINGMNNTFEDSTNHAAYLSQLVGGQSISWVHNQSHGALVDLAEVFTSNYLGFSPNTGKLLTETWEEFHCQNRDHPHAKFLQFCHSQGAIHVRNALAHAPQEIRDRVIVVAIAPAVVVPQDLCYSSFNYASKRDIVHYGELAFLGALSSEETGVSSSQERSIQEHLQLVLLEPHPEATALDHEFQSPTFQLFLEKIFKNYSMRGGEYLPEEKGKAFLAGEDQ